MSHEEYYDIPVVENVKKILEPVEIKCDTISDTTLMLSSSVDVNNLIVNYDPRDDMTDEDVVNQTKSHIVEIDHVDAITRQLLEFDQQQDTNNDIQPRSDIISAIFDGDETVEYRTFALDTLWNIDTDSAHEIVNTIRNMCIWDYNQILSLFVLHIVSHSKVSCDLLYQCAITLYEEDKVVGRSAFYFLIHHDNISTLSFAMQVNMHYCLQETLDYPDLSCWFKLLENQFYPIETRYRACIDLSKKSTIIPSLIIKTFYHWFQTCNQIQYKILAAQYILQHREPHEYESVELECQGFSQQCDLDYNLRADVSDLLIRLGTPESREIGIKTITELGRTTKVGMSLYSNRENVHDQHIDTSVEKFILQIAGLPSSSSLYDDVCDELKILTIENKYTYDDKIERVKDERDVDRVTNSLMRIALDSTIYSGNQSLTSIFLKIWQIIITHEQVDDLKSRLIEELIDMTQTCTSGHVSRLCNVLSGYDIFNINIGFKNQITSNFIGRLNCRIRDIQDEELQYLILSQMSNADYNKRHDFNKFLMDNIMSLRVELQTEFVDSGHVTCDDFECWFREALCVYDAAD